MVHLPDDRTAGTVTAALVTAMRRIPGHMCQSLTWDQGSEMAEQEAISRALGIPIYSCDAASPWQRGTNENTKGLLRQYFPKGTGLSVHSPADLRRVEREINARLRKAFGGRTCAEVVDELTAILDPHHCDDR